VVGDMISLGVWLAQGVSPRYWDHVERAVRNTLARSQFFLTYPFVAMFRRIHADKPALAVEDALRALRRAERGFVAQATFDDWVSYPGNPALGAPGTGSNGIHMMGCCPPEGLRGVWEAWRWCVEERPGEVRVNMSLMREHPAARVSAWRCEDGGYEVAALRAGRYLLRVPAWADRGRIELVRNGEPVDVDWGGPEGAYVTLPDVNERDVLRVRWPVPSFSQTFVPTSVEGRTGSFTMEWQGNQVTGVTPGAEHLTMFNGRRT